MREDEQDNLVDEPNKIIFRITLFLPTTYQLTNNFLLYVAKSESISLS